MERKEEGKSSDYIDIEADNYYSDRRVLNTTDPETQKHHSSTKIF
jgi:hypothetical protein